MNYSGDDTQIPTFEIFEKLRRRPIFYFYWYGEGFVERLFFPRASVSRFIAPNDFLQFMSIAIRQPAIATNLYRMRLDKKGRSICEMLAALI